MASAAFDDPSTPYDDRAAAEPRGRSLGEHVFIWIAWALAAAFWGAVLTTMAGILEAVARPTPMTSGGADAGGVGFLLMDVVGGLAVLGLALAVGAWMSSRRDRRLDGRTETATAALYDTIERQGGEDMTDRSVDPGRREHELR